MTAPLRILVRFLALLAPALPLAGCQTTKAPSESTPAAPTVAHATPKEAEWLVGYVWPAMDDGPVLMAARRTLKECVLGKTEGVAGTKLVEIPRTIYVVAPDGAEKIAAQVHTPAGQPAARELRVRWADDVGRAGRLGVLLGAQRVLRGEPPCPSATG